MNNIAQASAKGSRHLFRIYSHSDADGGIAAAIFTRFILDKYGKFGWDVDVQPVNHISGQGAWPYKEIQWPCAVLDFTLHPSLLSDKFHNTRIDFSQKMKDAQIPQCYWIDHHPTGSNFSFLTELNTHEVMPQVLTKWDTLAISTPGLLRTHHQELGIPLHLIREYEEFIDLAEIIDGALYATSEAAHDFSNPAVKLQTIFNSSHPAIDRAVFYKRLVRQIKRNPSVEDFFDSDFLFSALIMHEEQEYYKQLRSYTKASTLIKNVAVANFSASKDYAGMGRFIPYVLFKNAQYAIHVLPKHNSTRSHSISCGINPWNKPPDANKHIGNYFAKNFAGGGHSFVAGGKIHENDFKKLERLIEFLNQ